MRGTDRFTGQRQRIVHAAPQALGLLPFTPPGPTGGYRDVHHYFRPEGPFGVEDFVAELVLDTPYDLHLDPITVPVLAGVVRMVLHAEIRARGERTGVTSSQIGLSVDGLASIEPAEAFTGSGPTRAFDPPFPSGQPVGSDVQIWIRGSFHDTEGHADPHLYLHWYWLDLITLEWVPGP